MGVVEWVDEKVLQFFTSVSHKFQRLTGRTNYFLAWCSGVIVAVSCFVEILNYWMPVLAMPTRFLDFLMETLLLALTSAQIILAATIENKYLADPSSWVVGGKPNTPWLRLIRAISLMFATILTPIALPTLLVTTKSVILEIIAGSTLAAVSCFYYFMAVTPLPPRKGKIREWTSGLVNKFRKPESARVRD